MMNLGATKTTGNPSSKIVEETLTLLQVVGGGDKKVRALLEEMKKTQTHNEKVFGGAKQAITEAKEAQALASETIKESIRAATEVAKAQAKLGNEVENTSNALLKRGNELIAKETTLNAEKATFEAKKLKEMAALTRKDNDLTGRIVAVEKRETKCAESQKEADDLIQAVKNPVREMMKYV